ncbi:transposase [Dehalococcoidia bacterium]|nr:transposase [Dehalococcoidia bacterium]
MKVLCLKSESFIRLLDETECYRQLRQLRWPNGKVLCPYCGGDQIAKSWSYFREPACLRYKCGFCRSSFNDKTGTVFEETKLPLSAWFLGFYLAQLSQSTSAIAKELPCDYRTAHRIVWLVREGVIHLEAGRVLIGTVEVDEIYTTAGHKGQAHGGGPKGLPFPRRRGKKTGAWERMRC